MKKLTKLFAGFAAAAALLMGVSCTTQDDYVNEAKGSSTAVRNAFNLAGIYVEGLDESLNGSNFELKVAIINDDGEKEDFTAVTGTVADSYTDDNGKTVGHKSGTIYSTDVENNGLYDGDAMAVRYQKAQIANGKTGDEIATFAASTFECYLTVGNTTFKAVSEDGSKEENIKLAVPTSPAGTSNDALQSRWFKVVILNGVATYSLANSVTEPVNVTLANIKLDLKDVASDNLPSGVTCTPVAKTGTNQKFTLTIKGLADNDGTKVILSGSKISMEDSKVSDVTDWVYDKKTEGFVQEIKNGEVSWTFYGATPTQWTQYRTWGTNNETVGPEIQISDYNDGAGDNNSNPRLLENPTALGTDGTSFNFLFPKYAIGDYDVTLVIDKSVLDGEYVSQDDPTVAAAEIYIDAVYIANVPDLTVTSEYYITGPDDGTKGRTFMDGIEQNGGLKDFFEQWNPDSAQKLVVGKNSVALAWKLDEAITVAPGQKTFVLGFRTLPLKDDDNESFDWDKNIAFESPNLQTVDFAGSKKYTIYADAVTKVITLLETDGVDFSNFPLTIKTLKVTGWTKDWTPRVIGEFSNWTSDTELTAVNGETGVYEVELNTTTGIIPGKQFKFRKDSDWSESVGGYADGNIAWPDILSADSLIVTCVIDSDGKVENPVTYKVAD